ncbi:MAG: tetratricopeptide repeat protein [Crocinitomicaceae bacterium]|nr:tetratricopeptide repeat protein [Crocinitomicaceae bacterium]
MKTLKYLSLALTLLLFSCGGDEEVVYDEQEKAADVPTADYDEISAELDSMELALAKNPKDQELMKKTITRMQDFVHFFPEDPKSPNYLFKASDFSLQVNAPAKSVKLLDRIIAEYPDYNRMIDVEYNKASHLDWELRDTTRAKEAYQTFIDKYPNDNRAQDAAIRIKYIRYGWDEYTNMIFEGKIEPVVQ